MIIRLPVCDDLGSAAVQGEVGPIRSLNVLVVDDDPSAREILAKYLTADGHCAMTVGNGAQAVRTFQQQNFDLLMTDQGMPGMNGLQLSRYIRQIRANQPIILLTGFSFDADNLPTEVDKVIPKPITPDRLRAALAEVVRV